MSVVVECFGCFSLDTISMTELFATFLTFAYAVKFKMLDVEEFEIELHFLCNAIIIFEDDKCC